MQDYRAEFPDFGELDVQLPNGFVDVSWHNEPAPSFGKLFETGAYLRIVVDYADPAKRETPSLERFHAVLYANESEDAVIVEHSNNDWNVLLLWVGEQESADSASKSSDLFRV